MVCQTKESIKKKKEVPNSEYLCTEDFIREDELLT